MTERKCLRAEIRKTAYWLIFFLMGAQILMGIIWILANLSGFQNFAETEELLEVSRTRVLDEYIGIFYPVVIRLSCEVEKMTGIAYYTILYIMQLGCAYGAAVYFLHRTDILRLGRGIGGKWRTLYGAAYLLTIPMAAQCHLAVLPFSFAASFFLIFLAECLVLSGAHEQENGKRVWLLAGAWVLGALCLPEYAWLEGILALTAMAGYMWKRKKAVLRLLIAFAASALLIWTVGSQVQTPGSRGKIQRSASAVLLSRTVWPNFDRNSYFWNIYITDVFQPDDLTRISREPENVLYEFGPEMEYNYGIRMAQQQYRQMAEASVLVRTKECLTEIGRDIAFGLCPQISVKAGLEGRGVSYTGWNYSRMQEYMPVLTKEYVNISLNGFLAALLPAILLLSVYKRKKSGISGKSAPGRGEMALLLLTVIMFAVWNGLTQNGMIDYRSVLPNGILWAVLVVKSWNVKGGQQDECME